MDKFFGSIDTLIDMNEYNQREYEKHRAVMSPEQWALEMATVQVSVGRRMGKTSYIKSRARCADLVITHNDMMKKEYKDSRATVLSAGNLQYFMRDGWRGRKPVGYNIVYVDEPVLVFNDVDIWEFYSVFSGQQCLQACANTFVMIGTGLILASR